MQKVAIHVSPLLSFFGSRKVLQERDPRSRIPLSNGLLNLFFSFFSHFRSDTLYLLD